jgi:hypothetical protein
MTPVLETGTLVTLLLTKYARSWPKHREVEVGERAWVVPLGEALERRFECDAHFAAYVTPNARRLSREAIDAGVSTELTCVIFDVDCPDTHGTPEPAPEGWRRTMREKVDRLAEAHPDPYYYETRGGSRIGYVQRETTIIRSQEDAHQWRRAYAVCVAYLARRFGIDADGACADWQRLYRLPRATREPGGEPENWPTRGDPHRIGCLEIDATRADVHEAMRRSRAFRIQAPTRGSRSLAGGRGLLFHALRARGDIFSEHSPGAYVVRCPHDKCLREQGQQGHSVGRPGDTSTLLYLPRGAEAIGAIHCMHAHCAGMTVRDWLTCFSCEEIEAARHAASMEKKT